MPNIAKIIRTFFRSVFFKATNWFLGFAESYQQILCENYPSQEFFGPYFPCFGPNTRKYRPEKNSVFWHSDVNETSDISLLPQGLVTRKLYEICYFCWSLTSMRLSHLLSILHLSGGGCFEEKLPWKSLPNFSKNTPSPPGRIKNVLYIFWTYYVR